jgi:hypothetical protein
MGTIMLWNGLERIAVLNHKLARQNVIMYCSETRYTVSVPGALLQLDCQYFYQWLHYYNTTPLDCNANCGRS